MKFEHIQQAVIGANQLFKTPFGEKPLVYADYTASGRPLTFIEDYIRQQVMPWYANTHTEFSFSGGQTSHYREQARQIIHQAVNGSVQDEVIFCGAGATAAIDKLVGILGIRLPADLDAEYQLSGAIPEAKRPVVFVGPYEHHSNELPWRESIATVVRIPDDEQGQIDQQALKTALVQYADRPLKIGSFSAASNVTGIRSDIESISALLKQHDAISCWDYAAAAPYVGIDMNAESSIDAVFFSPHKFVGGPGTPGILIIKRSLLTNSVPVVVGGGTVHYVTPFDHQYLSNPPEREEGGTPAILEAIRAGLVVELQQTVGLEAIEQRELALIRKTIKHFEAIEQISILGNTDVPRIGIFSLRFRHKDKELHHGFITALLNDLFGIQVRGGCSCAGPYGHELLGIDMQHSRQLEQVVNSGLGIFRPGWVRFNLNYFMSDQEVDYILSAIEAVGRYGHRLLPYYEPDLDTGVWRFQGQSPNYHQLGLTNSDGQTVGCRTDYASLLAEGIETLTADYSDRQTYQLQFDEQAEAMRWFCLASDFTLQT